MKNLELLRKTLHDEEVLHRNDIYNYVIPESWNVYGFRDIRRLRDRQLILNPYAFYKFTLDNMFDHRKPCKLDHNEDSIWFRYTSMYSFMVRTATSWDHDRDNVISHDNLYHMADNGTFLKSIILLPLLKRMGISTLIMHQPFSLTKTQKPHDYAQKEAVFDFQQIDNQLADPLIPNMSSEDQCSAFIEACHFFGMHVILEYCPGTMARNNIYINKHPEWFYWISSSYEKDYHAPICNTLPQNTLPYEYTIKELYKSEDVIHHIKQFKSDLDGNDTLVIAPSIVDQINANIAHDIDTTIPRFYKDRPVYMMQDTIRSDLYPGKQPQRTLWNQIKKQITWYQEHLHIDGIYLEKPYLLPEKLQIELCQSAKKNHSSFVMIAEDALIENSEKWLSKGYDMISGNSGYEESHIWDYKFHNVAYRLKGNACPMFAAAEFFDSRRISCLEQGKRLAIMLTIMNHFLPNGIPMLMNGIESFDVQPMQLSVYGDQGYVRSLTKEDPRYHHQAYIDQYYFNYCHSDLSTLPNILEIIHPIRTQYITSIINPEKCIPVWFDSPKDLGIGFTFLQANKALMAVCNVDVNNANNLHIHTDNLLPELPFQVASIKQIYTTAEPFIQELHFDESNNLLLHFEAGEVKLIEFESQQ